MPAYFDTGFTVREPAWHGIRPVRRDYQRHLCRDRDMAGSTCEPELVPVYQRIATPLGVYPDGSLAEREDYVAVPNARLIQRSDTNAVLGHGVSDRYVPLLNKPTFEVLDAPVTHGLKVATPAPVTGGPKWSALR